MDRQPIARGNSQALDARRVGSNAPMSPVPAGNRGDHLGKLIKGARRKRALSQLELSLRIGVSQRHLGFVELGRARPSRPLLLRLLDELGASPSLVNAALHHADYASRGVGAEGADQLMLALDQMVRAHEPFPAVVFDADWYGLYMNRGAWWLCDQGMPGHWQQGGVLDMIAAVGAPDGMLSRVRDPHVAGGALLAQFRAEAWARPSLRERVEACAAALKARFGSALDSDRDPSSPSMSLTFDTRFGDLSFFAIQTVPGIPQDVSLGSIRAELWFPLEDRTRTVMMTEVPRTAAC